MAQSESGDEFVSQKVLEYERFLNETLREDLRKVLDERDKVYTELSKYLELKNIITSLQEARLGGGELKTKVDLGCNFYVQAKVPDTSRIYVCVGFGFYVEFTHEEALRFIDKKEKILNERSEHLTKDASKIKANIKIVIEGLREIQHIEAEAQKPQREVF